jgi:hypothetical protein
VVVLVLALMSGVVLVNELHRVAQALDAQGGRRKLGFDPGKHQLRDSMRSFLGVLSRFCNAILMIHSIQPFFQGVYLDETTN